MKKEGFADTDEKTADSALPLRKPKPTLLPDEVRAFEMKRDRIKRLSRALENEIRLLGLDAQVTRMRLNELQRPPGEQALRPDKEREDFLPAEIEKLENYLLGNSLHREVLQEAMAALANDTQPPADLDQVLGALEKRRAEQVAQLNIKKPQSIAEEADYKAATNALKSLSDLHQKLNEHFKL